MAHDIPNTDPEPDSFGSEDHLSREIETPDGNCIDVISDTSAWPEAQFDAAADLCVTTCDYLQDFFDLPAIGVSVLLTDDHNMRSLNHQFRDIDKSTNVLSFPAAEDDQAEDDTLVALGDIAIAYETVVREAEDGDIAVADHLAHLIVHGLLHLLGYDHESNADAEEMEALEIAILSHFGIANPYAGSDPIGHSVRQDHA